MPWSGNGRGKLADRVRGPRHPPPPSGSNREMQSPDSSGNDNNATVHDDKPCYNALVDALKQGGDLQFSSASSLPFCLTQLLPQVLPKRLLVLVSCVHVPMPCPHADGLPHDAVRTHVVVESAAIIMPQPSPQDHRQVLHQDHQSVSTLLAPDGYRHGQGRHRAVPPLVYQFNQRLDYLVGDVVRTSSHWTASLAVLLCLCCRRPPPIVTVDIVVVAVAVAVTLAVVV